MVLRQKKRSRKFLGKRTWNAGNKKNNRGKGVRGGVGKGGRKHAFTYMVKYAPERIRLGGFSKWNKKRVYEVDLDKVAKLAKESKDAKPTITLEDCKVLGDGNIDRAIVVKAKGFSKSALEKIQKAGGEAVKI
jgi:large subunit ribosomal protein L15